VTRATRFITGAGPAFIFLGLYMFMAAELSEPRSWEDALTTFAAAMMGALIALHAIGWRHRLGGYGIDEEVD
jgi:succinate dehydrogenase/fumarate reductase cytochrome b subunit